MGVRDQMAKVGSRLLARGRRGETVDPEPTDDRDSSETIASPEEPIIEEGSSADSFAVGDFGSIDSSDAGAVREFLDTVVDETEEENSDADGATGTSDSDFGAGSSSEPSREDGDRTVPDGDGMRSVEREPGEHGFAASSDDGDTPFDQPVDPAPPPDPSPHHDPIHDPVSDEPMSAPEPDPVDDVFDV